MILADVQDRSRQYLILTARHWDFALCFIGSTRLPNLRTVLRWLPCVGRYASAAASALAQGEEWKKTTLKTALLFPGVVFAIFFMLNLLVWGQRSSGAVPFGTLFALCFLWFGISVPLVFIGSYFGYKKPAPEVQMLMPVCVVLLHLYCDERCLALVWWKQGQMSSVSLAPRMLDGRRCLMSSDARRAVYLGIV